MTDGGKSKKQKKSKEPQCKSCGFLCLGISNNHLNLPTYVPLSGGNISYIYDATGVKLEKKVTEGSTITKTLYAETMFMKK